MNEQTNQAPAPQNLAAAPTLTVEPAPIRRRRPYKSKITSLPPDVRAFLNQSIYDNVPYGEIIEQLKTKGHPGFNRVNLTRWVKSGYQDWVLERERIQSLGLKMGDPKEWINQFESLGLTECKQFNSLMLAAQMAQAMRDFDPKALTNRLNAAPELLFKLGRIINAQSLEHQRQQKIDLLVKKRRDEEEAGPTEMGRMAVKEFLNLPDSWIKPAPNKLDHPTTS
ncbi:MAG: hypothetical protein JWO95_3383 [Verrucomicrobiales bacterium]|nr:hypothetical protein [Verrucomicrobiales bacterium]